MQWKEYFIIQGKMQLWCQTYKLSICLVNLNSVICRSFEKTAGIYDENKLLLLRREEKPSRCHWMVYCTFNMLNMFRELLCPSSGAREFICVITAYGVPCLVAGCRGSGAGQQAMRPGRGMLHGSVVQYPYSWTHSLLPGTWPPTTSNQARHTIGGSKTRIVSSSWWWAQKCPKHVEHIKSAINHSVASSCFFFSSLRVFLSSSPSRDLSPSSQRPGVN